MDIKLKKNRKKSTKCPSFNSVSLLESLFVGQGTHEEKDLTKSVYK